MNFTNYGIATVIPAYRVERDIESVIRGLPAYIKHVIVVDDASPDSCADLVAAAVQKDIRTTVLIVTSHCFPVTLNLIREQGGPVFIRQLTKKM